MGGTVGAATGTVGGILGIDDRPRFRDYVVREHRPSFHYSEEIHPGIVLPQRSVRLYDVPTEYHVRPAYAYTVINETPVIVERRTRRVVEVIELHIYARIYRLHNGILRAACHSVVLP